MAQRLELQTLLLTFAPNVYFQPPASLAIKYPCIIYKRDKINTDFADNKPYKHKKRYQLTVIDREPDSDIHERIGELPLCSHDRSYSADNLNHDVFNLFF